MILEKTKSLCPVCKRPLEAEVFEKGDEVWIRKECPEHGLFEEKYWENKNMYLRAKNFAFTWGRLATHNTKYTENLGINCPFDCGLCPRHKSHTALANLVATNRCDLSCWYCFFYAKPGQPIYEPPLELIRDMLRNLRKEAPVPTKALQITGGEPLLRDDIVDIVKIAKEEGFVHVQVNTNGIRLAQDPEIAKKLREAGTNTLYLSFDGVSEKTNPKNHWEIPFAFKHLREAQLGCVLVPTIIKGVNDHEIGDIVNFALNHIDIVRGVNFQPVSLTGMMPRDEREKYRITIPKVIKLMEEQSDGTIYKDAFFPVPTVAPISRLVEALTNQPQFYLSTHFACGMATYLFLDGDKVVPITDFVDVEGFLEYINQLTDDVESGKNKYWLGLKALFKLRSFIDKSRQPKGLNLYKILVNALVKHDYHALGEFHMKTLFIGMMHFMDLYNYDVQRVERCQIHYVMPDGRIVPFCAFNVIPEIYRDKIQRDYSYSWDEWIKMHPGYDMKKEKYVRTPEMIEKMENSKEYKETYINIKRFW